MLCLGEGDQVYFEFWVKFVYNFVHVVKIKREITNNCSLCEVNLFFQIK